MPKVTIEGMRCNNCVKHVTEHLSQKVSNVKVDLASKTATFEGNTTVDELNATLADTRFKITGIQK
ncbi:heavy-metal-associated domain-containing protein [Lentilactobacillus parafarraginis]|uniref:Heavy-metal-associated domain-containing protein n=1 Tax=Lentilactobacillus parafarraginis TaxID=390842 RepID=A0A5R9CUR2_9LACO|nr:heavy metal-associated domain-containing protein [Lentilactobacillus parafarraginis]TLQ19175.1 heavy-metal-associated domain-containing protein [Lentilactobacillus parafarraginis]